MVTVHICSKLKTSWKSVVFTKIKKGGKNSRVIPLALHEYEMIIANSYPMRTHGIIVTYSLNFSGLKVMAEIHANVALI